MHPTIMILGETYSSYTVVNHVLGFIIPAIFYFIFLRGYSLKRGVKIEWPKLLLALAFILIGGRFVARGIYEIMYSGSWGFVLNYKLGESSIMFGGFIGAILSITIITYLRKRKTLFWLDVTSIWLTIAIGVRKIGCFMTGCCGGTPTSLPWAVMSPSNFAMVHPLQLYESIFGFAMAIFLWWRMSKNDKPDGTSFAIFAASFSFLRLITLPIRAVSDRVEFVFLAPMGFFLLALGAVGMYLYLTHNEQSSENQNPIVEGYKV